MRHTKAFTLASLCGNIIFLIAFILDHILRSNLSVLSSFVSEYAEGDYGWIMTVGFLSLGISQLFLIAALLQNLAASKTSIITFGVWCSGLFLVAIFPADLPGEQPSIAGIIHNIAALLAFINIGIAMIEWGFTFRKNKNWQSMVKLSWFFGIISISLFIIFLLSPPSFSGLAERVLIIWDILWLLLVIRVLFSAVDSVPVNA